MAHCIALTKGRELDCSRISGGVRYLYFGVYDQYLTPIETAGIVQSAGTVTDINMEAASVIYRYAMPLGAASVTETIIIPANQHNTIIALGVTNGMALNTGTMDTGAGFGDRNGYTLTFDGLEPNPFPFVADYTTEPFDNTAFSDFTVDID